MKIMNKIFRFINDLSISVRNYLPDSLIQTGVLIALLKVAKWCGTGSFGNYYCRTDLGVVISGVLIAIGLNIAIRRYLTKGIKFSHHFTTVNNYNSITKIKYFI